MYHLVLKVWPFCHISFICLSYSLLVNIFSEHIADNIIHTEVLSMCRLYGCLKNKTNFLYKYSTVFILKNNLHNLI